MTLLVSEVFGPTFQGEGFSLGRRAAFVRLGRCNLDCGKGAGATWACDTPYTWDWERYDPAAELAEVTVDEVVARVAAMGVDRVVVTVEVETNGTIAPLPEVAALVERFNVSPKTANSGVPASRALRRPALEALRDTGRAVFKFVVADVAELDDVAEVVDTFGLSPVMVMAAGTTSEEILDRGRKLADPVLARGWHLTTRLHVLLWGDERCR